MIDFVDFLIIHELYFTEISQLIWFLLSRYFLAVIAKEVAARRGNHNIFYYYFTLVFGIIGWIAAACAPKKINLDYIDSYENIDIPLIEFCAMNIEERDVNSPVDILKWYIYSKCNMLYGNFDWKVYNNNISACEFLIYGYDINNNLTDKQAIQINFDFDEPFEGESQYFPLNNNTIRFDIEITEIMQNGDERIAVLQKNLITRNFDSFSGKILKAVQRDNKNILCYPVQEKDYWRCSCGFPNNNNSGICDNCLSGKDAVFSKVTESYLEELIK